MQFVHVPHHFYVNIILLVVGEYLKGGGSALIFVRTQF